MWHIPSAFARRCTRSRPIQFRAPLRWFYNDSAISMLQGFCLLTATKIFYLKCVLARFARYEFTTSKQPIHNRFNILAIDAALQSKQWRTETENEKHNKTTAHKCNDSCSPIFYVAHSAIGNVFFEGIILQAAPDGEQRNRIYNKNGK